MKSLYNKDYFQQESFVYSNEKCKAGKISSAYINRWECSEHWKDEISHYLWSFWKL